MAKVQKIITPEGDTQEVAEGEKKNRRSPAEMRKDRRDRLARLNSEVQDDAATVLGEAIEVWPHATSGAQNEFMVALGLRLKSEPSPGN